MADPASFPDLLVTAPTISIDSLVARRVPDDILHSNVPPDYLFTSGKKARYSVAGVHCAYFAADEITAIAEYEKDLLSGNRFQPVTTFWAEAKLGKVIDLTNPDCLYHFGLVTADLQVTWRLASSPTLTQQLGAAIAHNTSGITAIRYPSEAMRLIGKTGTNFVIYRDRIAAPDSLTIKGPGNTVLQRWP
ncbi:MAG TPA: RES family NAD+ phosphorylase [Kiritimatiellia bacterium]|nr:RES family NAD+ phosphorylase [Kiritimatiellia bacterium]HMO97873.1 RES family NAD+ phosphorylase [Kiritimatiellia bacterium]